MTVIKMISLSIDICYDKACNFILENTIYVGVWNGRKNSFSVEVGWVIKFYHLY